jgi:hypothetical protein
VLQVYFSTGGTWRMVKTAMNLLSCCPYLTMKTTMYCRAARTVSFVTHPLHRLWRNFSVSNISRRPSKSEYFRIAKYRKGKSVLINVLRGAVKIVKFKVEG